MAIISKRMRLSMFFKAILKSVWNWKILSIDFAQFSTMKRWECIDAAGDPIPWYTYPASEYLKQLDFSDKRVLEYGSGYSTIFWSRRAKHVVSIEDSPGWYEKIKPLLPGNVTYRLYPRQDEYVDAINRLEGLFDIIVIDGSHRSDCVRVALPKLAKDGFIILDNSDWEESASQALREAGLIEVDMAGFGPIARFTTTTSFYFTRSVHLKPRYNRQPMPGIGAAIKKEDRN